MFLETFLPDLKNILPGPAIFGTGLTIRNNEWKDIVKVIKYLENRGFVLKNLEFKKLLNFLGH